MGSKIFGIIISEIILAVIFAALFLICNSMGLQYCSALIPLWIAAGILTLVVIWLELLKWIMEIIRDFLGKIY